MVPLFAYGPQSDKFQGVYENNELFYQALNFGLVTQVVSQEELLPAAAALAQKILKNSPFAIGQAIQAVNAAYEEGLNGFEAEVNGFGTCFGSEDFKEGTQAFLEKRKANFTGN